MVWAEEEWGASLQVSLNFPFTYSSLRFLTFSFILTLLPHIFTGGMPQLKPRGGGAGGPAAAPSPRGGMNNNNSYSPSSRGGGAAPPSRGGFGRGAPPPAASPAPAPAPAPAPTPAPAPAGRAGFGGRGAGMGAAPGAGMGAAPRGGGRGAGGVFLFAIFFYFQFLFEHFFVHFVALLPLSPCFLSAPPVAPAKPRQPQCQALYDFDPVQDGDLGFKTGDIINIVDESGEWWTGELNGRQGVFPGNYTKKL